MEASIIIPVYNGQATIEKCLKSIISQKVNFNFEVILINDGSKDNTEKIAKDLKSKKIRVVKHEKNLGLAKATNTGITNAKSDIVIMLLQDYILPSKDWLKKSLTIFKKENADLMLLPVDVPKEIFSKFGFFDKLDAFMPALDVIYRKKEDRLIFFKKTLLEKISFDERYKFGGEDLDFLLKTKKQGFKVLMSKEPEITHYHVSHTSFKKYLKKLIQISEANGMIFRKYHFLWNKYRNEITNSIIFIGLLIPYIQWLSAFLILAEAFVYTLLFLVKTKDIRGISLFFIKIFKNLLAAIFFWKGFITNKQTRF